MTRHGRHPSSCDANAKSAYWVRRMVVSYKTRGLTDPHRFDEAPKPATTKRKTRNPAIRVYLDQGRSITVSQCLQA